GSSGQDGYHVSGGGGNIFPTNNSYRPTGAGADYGYPGTFLMGGLGGTTAFGDGGDGGCGWYGGGGGQAITNTAAVNAVPAERKVGGSGGGGSSYAWGGNNITIEAASGYAAANSADSDYVAGKAVGGTTGAGGAGYAVIKTGCTCPGGLCPPPACTYEGDAAFCNTRRKNCGNVVGTDTCGTQRTVDCGAATTTTCNAPDVCTDNVCRSTDDLGYNECRIEPGASCDFGDVGLFSLYTGDVSHITQYNSSLYYHMCCNINATMTPYYNNEQCPEEALFAYYTFNNSHVSQYEIPATRFRLCLHGIYGIAQCTYESNNGTCDSNEAGVASIKDDMPYKSHVAEYGVLGRNVCCSFDGSIDIEGTWIAGIEYFCGTSDGICPENLETSIGDTALCDNIYDYDCAAQAACYTPEGEKILTGQNVTLYSQSTVACSSSCDTVATVCTCTAGEFDCNTTTYSIGSCTVNSSVVAGGQCSSAANACGVTNTSGVYDACGVCSSTTPALPAGYGQSCSSPPNSCGIVSTSGTIQCDGRCSSVTPADNATLGAACQSSANACGQTTAGTMQCANYGVDNSVSCSVSAAPGFTAPHDLYGTSCAGLIGPNSCGTSWTAVQAAYGCNNVCNQTAPPPVSSNYGQACQTCNSCGQCNTGTYQCNGACSASAPAYTGAHSNYGTACSASNACGQSNAGTYSCNNVCSVTSPTYSGAHSLYGQACTSAANACGEVAAGVYGCNNVCSASTPSLPWYYDTACVSNQNNCGATSNGKRYCDYNSCEVSGSPGTPLSAPANCAYSAPSYYCGPVFPDFDYQYYTAGCQGTSCAVPAFLGACPRDTSECVGQVRYQTAGCANGVCVKNFVEDCATNAAWCAAFGGGAADGNGDLVGSWTCNAAANECSWSLIDGCNAWNCVGNDLYKQGGCSGDGNVKTPDTCSNYFQQTCPNGCSNGACIP
ncbi:MAG TPA: hypothetical protein VK158_05835, partial [Acidobacteriota bacterium]|nr:hypothetical protein [Acidobacteriota bacterium]